MSNEVKYVNVALNAYGQTTVYVCDIEDIRTGDFVIVPAMSGEVTGRVMSYTQKKVFSLSLARIKKVIRKADPKEINDVADLFGIAKNLEFAEDEDDGSFLTNSGYGTRELNKMMKKLQEKQEAKEIAKVERQENQQATADTEAKAEAKAAADILQQKLDKLEKEDKPKNNTFIKDDNAIPGYWRYVAIGILAMYFLKDYIFE